MKKRELEELKRMSPTELEKLGSSLLEEIRVLSFDIAAGKVKNIKALRSLRKKRARVLTLLTTSRL